MNWLRVSLITAVCTTVASIALILIMPEGTTLPLHWNAAGEVDKTKEAQHALIFPPAVMWGMLALVGALKFFEPRKENLSQSRKAIGAMTGAVILLMLVIEIGYIALLQGMEFSMHFTVVFSIGVALMIIGNYIGKTRSNYFIGIRTPWTLNNDDIWQKTHRMATPIFMASGAILAIACWFITPEMLTYLMSGLLGPVVIFPTVYSWWLWKKQ